MTARVMTAAIATSGPNSGIPDGVLIGVAVAVVAGSGVLVSQSVLELALESAST